ncbi:O-succinylbenzoic acid--CoA ligase [Lutibacter oricola]|uniref:O-succinylbenzoic acid--CoA ligase n=1 Tax=Lutibacter oricola TaxID=762486 RepID=A0A1H3C5A6_9FLAO|nr:AMP-binding protein [Lutibacter oricola]SDX49271.1 O-succinylbenzoic acid--CoA ligase [Lutibacter oricola]
MIKNQFHKSFNLNEKSFTEVEELINFSKTISVEVHSFLIDWFDTKLFVEVKTSGSTGTPKIIKLQKEFMINSALATGSYFNLNEKTTALLCMSANYIAGKMMLVRALTLGWHLDVVEANSNPLKDLDKTYDFSAMVPLQLNNSLNEIHKVKRLIVGGGVVSNELLQKIKNIKTEIFATYGMTETITHIAVKRLNYHSEGNEESHYTTLTNISISKDKRGCLIINAPKVSSEEIITNDLVELISEKEFKWLGRYDSVINSGGIKLIPEQIEEKLSSIINNRFFVAGIQDAVLGEKLVLIVEGNIDNGTLNQVKNLNSLSKFEIPKEIFFTSKFVETPTKKINRLKTLSLLNKD